MATMHQGAPADELVKLGWKPHDPFEGLAWEERPIGGDWHFRKPAGRKTSEARVDGAGRVWIKCPRCSRESPNMDDVRHQFCVACGFHEFL